MFSTLTALLTNPKDFCIFILLVYANFFPEGDMTISFFFTLSPTLKGALLPSVFLIVIQFLFMAIFREGGRRAVDTSWYNQRDKRFANMTMILQVAIIIISIFLPFKWGTAWFIVGMAIYAISLVMFVWAFFSYGKAPKGETIQNGIYRYSRNPMYFFYMAGTLGIAIACASLWLLLILIIFAWGTHGVILGEERYCAETYGEPYLDYKAKTPRYFFFV